MQKRQAVASLGIRREISNMHDPRWMVANQNETLGI